MPPSNSNVRITLESGHPSARSKRQLWAISGQRAPPQKTPLFDHIVSEREQLRRNFEIDFG
jgi:hypothetical protein